MNEKQLDEGRIKTIRQLTKFFREEKIDLDEYASNIIIHLVSEPYVEVCNLLSDLQTIEKEQLLEYARVYFRDNEFTPNPTVFMVDMQDANEIEQKRQEMKPKYQLLLKHLEECVNLD